VIAVAAAAREETAQEGLCSAAGAAATASAGVAVVGASDAPANATAGVPTDREDESILETARALEPPVPSVTADGDTEGAEWWLEHGDLLRSAWTAWYRRNRQRLPPLGPGLIGEDLRGAVERARSAPTTAREDRALRLWDPVPFAAAGDDDDDDDVAARFFVDDDDDDAGHHVYECPGFLTVEGVRRVRAHLDALSVSGIPVRRPNAMNRRGLLLGGGVPGGVSGDPALSGFVESLASDYLRPLGRALFPELAGDPSDDSAHYAFTIRYGGGGGGRNATSEAAAPVAVDRDLPTHSDASLYTLNINLNLPGEGYAGSRLYFLAPSSSASGGGGEDAVATVDFAPGTAVLHRGMTRHGARPLEDGVRNNLVVWLHGADDGYVRIAPYPPSDRMSVDQRWSSSKAARPPPFVVLASGT